MKNNMLFYCFSFLTSVLVLTGCDKPYKAADLSPQSAIYARMDNHTQLSSNIMLGQITVPPGMGSITPVTVEPFTGALMAALQQAGWYGSSGAYTLSSKIIDIEHPVFGLNYTVKAKIEYMLTENSTGAIKFHDTLVLPCTVMYAEVRNSSKRAEKATACAIKENITHLLNVLSQQTL